VRIWALSVGLALLVSLLAVLTFGGVSPFAVTNTIAIVVVYASCLSAVLILAIPPLRLRVRQVQFPLDWGLFLSASAMLIALGAGLASLLLFVVGLFPGNYSWNEILIINRLVFLVTLVSITLDHLYNSMKDRFTARSLELQEQLELGHKQLQLQQQEMNRAREIQAELLPKQLPQIRGFDLAAGWQPASTVSGDYFDVLRLADDAWGLCIADVAGKGIGAALLMSNLQAAVRAFAFSASAPHQLCERINQTLSSHTALDKFITFFYAILDPDDRMLRFSRAGQNLPILIRNDGSILRLEEGGPVLGVLPACRYEQGEVELLPGDRLLLFTDGVTDVTNPRGEDFGDARLVSLLAANNLLGARELQEKVMATITEFGAGVFPDDATLVVLSVERE
jgi:serine phosphatase RsbU (regulator of sigma subunit)